jgi:hypothetical protein
MPYQLLPTLFGFICLTAARHHKRRRLAKRAPLNNFQLVLMKLSQILLAIEPVNFLKFIFGENYFFEFFDFLVRVAVAFSNYGNDIYLIGQSLHNIPVILVDDRPVYKIKATVNSLIDYLDFFLQCKRFSGTAIVRVFLHLLILEFDYFFDIIGLLSLFVARQVNEDQLKFNIFILSTRGIIL